MRVIGITGSASAGKTTVARYLEEQYGYTRIRFADPLKRMLLEAGLTTDDVDGTTKEIQNDLLCGKTPREAMQTLGTEWGRKLIGPDFWVNSWKKRVWWEADCGAPGVVADDIRFENEVAAIYNPFVGIVVHVTRPGLTLNANVAAHESEKYANELPFDVHIINEERFDENGNPDLRGLLRQVDYRVARYRSEEKVA